MADQLSPDPSQRPGLEKELLEAKREIWDADQRAESHEKARKQAYADKESAQKKIDRLEGILKRMPNVTV